MSEQGERTQGQGRALGGVLWVLVGLLGIGAGAFGVRYLQQGVPVEAPDLGQPVAETPAEAQHATTANPETAPASETAAAPTTDGPEIELMRIEPNGATLVAGRAAPGQELTLLADGQEVARVIADQDGAFIGLFELPPSAAPRLLELSWIDEAGAVALAERSVVVAPLDGPAVAATQEGVAPDPTPDLGLGQDILPGAADPARAVAPAAPVQRAPEAFIAGRDGARPLVPSGLPAAAALAIDSITYGDRGEVVIQGRSGSAGALLLRLDGAAGPEAQLEAAGPWRLVLPDLAPGGYQLALEVTGEDGRVLARADTPFQRVAPERVSGSGVDVITVQPGASLWRIAREQYGDGVLYVQLFEANREAISNPNLIYPGQLLTVPE